MDWTALIPGKWHKERTGFSEPSLAAESAEFGDRTPVFHTQPEQPLARVCVTQGSGPEPFRITIDLKILLPGRTARATKAPEKPRAALAGNDT